jgi:molybdopterin-guanine dinucleotide biosynthesis protein
MGDKIRTTVAIGGFSSEVGKTTLVCEMLRHLPGWEAIKLTRGHYRSCGKDPHACCVSHLLSDEPLVRSGRRETYTPGKDTGRYWDAGASNVHWVIVTDAQVEQGIRLALERVRAPGVLIEGNSFLKFVDVDFAVMVARGDGDKLKPSARRALKVCSALYLSGDADETAASEWFTARLQDTAEQDILAALTLYTRAELPSLIARVRALP